jgi:chromosome segregation ATPase
MIFFGRLEKEAIVAELAAVKQEFEEYKMHEHIIKMSLQGMVSKFQTRCSSLQAEVLAQDSQPVSSKADWEEEKRSIVSHNRVVKAQMQERIDRLTALLMQERQARQNAYDANMKAMTKLEQIAVSDNNPKGVALQMDQYIAELHREMGALRDTVILLQNDNAELLNERSHLRGQRQQMQKAHQKAMKEQEAIFLADVKSKNLEIERLQVQIRDLAADKAKLKATAGQSGGRVGDKKAVTEKELEILERRIEDMSRWKAISDDSIITMQSRLDAGGGSSVEISQQLADAQGVIMDLEGKVSILSEQLDRERKKVTELEASVYDLSLSTKTLHAFMDVDTQSKTEALEWHEQDSARIKELEAKLGILKGSMLNVENDLGNARVSTEVLEEQHRKAVRELEQEIELLRRRCSDSEARKSSVVVKKVGNANALLELQAAMESATERSLYFESREAMLVQDKKHLQNQLDLLMEEKMSLEKAQELLLRENAHLKQEQAAGMASTIPYRNLHPGKVVATTVLKSAHPDQSYFVHCCSSRFAQARAGGGEGPAAGRVPSQS